MYKICFYVPVDQKESVKTAMFSAGAGKVGLYSSCSWEVLGEGQFMPLDGSNPFLGEKNEIEKGAEYKVEMVCAKEYIREVIAALKESHPYEEPAYQVFCVENI